ncbi:hypothetical protein [Paenibacillus rigui]|uniref:Hypervirulence associated protein TUDOR domain-containing protein n=1 Tax=Paenibacillus rigui TaxID=554312 RepID=A0A229UMJ1_9BACL|nr:hypothetical protein [Paenibacillus rigui]OXM84593.1 hypothetical protein CF651_18980 [Paenibacillus rigui]
MNVKILQVGDKVKWSSQAQGSVKEKAGMVIAIVPGGQRASKYLPDGIEMKNKTYVKFDTEIAKHVRYIVEVPRGGKSVKFDYYCPRVESLRMNVD